MKLLIDMNLPPRWVDFLRSRNIEAVHWSSIGKPDAPDQEILEHAAINGYIVFTHDLDFAFLLARSRSVTPSVIQTRVPDLRPESIGDLLIATIEQIADQLEVGCLVTINEDRRRVRLLPLA
jgi:predicted nuclease of predicted toxin-antitoxin system